SSGTAPDFPTGSRSARTPQLELGGRTQSEGAAARLPRHVPHPDSDPALGPRMILAVTGALGFLGHHFVDAALAAGHRCWLVDAETYAGNEAHLVRWVELLVTSTYHNIATT